MFQCVQAPVWVQAGLCGQRGVGWLQGRVPGQVQEPGEQQWSVVWWHGVTSPLQGTCLKDKAGNPYCQCVGSFTGDDCETKSEFAYIAGGTVII